MSIRQFGTALAKFLKTPSAQRILKGVDVEEWSSGGCWILAQALYHWLGPSNVRLYYVGSPMGVEHVVVKADGLFIDDHGAQTDTELLKRLGLEDAFIAPLDGRTKQYAEKEGMLYCPLDVAENLADALDRKFGDLVRA